MSQAHFKPLIVSLCQHPDGQNKSHSQICHQQYREAIPPKESGALFCVGSFTEQ